MIQQGQQALAQGRYRESRNLLFGALALDRELGRTRQTAEEQRMLGEIYTTFADYDSAFTFYTRALEQQKSLADRHAVRALTLELASLHHTLGEDRKAYTLYTEALRFASVFNDKDGVREIQWAMLPTCRTLENGEDESRILTDLLTYYAASGDLDKQAHVYFEAALSKQKQLDYDRALESLLRALSLAEQVRDSVLVLDVLAELGITYDEMGKPTEAFQSFAEALKRTDVTRGAERTKLRMLIRVGDIYLRNRQFGEARRFYNAALRSAIYRKDALAEGYLFIQLGHCDLQSSHEAAVKNYQAAMDLFKGVSYHPGSAYALVSLGFAAQRVNRYGDALAYFKMAVEQGELALLVGGTDELFINSERTFLRSHQTTLYDAVVELLLELGRFDEAFWYVERKHGRELFDHLSAFEIQTRDDQVNTLLRAFYHTRALRLGAERQLCSTLADNSGNREVIREININLDRSAKAMGDIAARIVERNGSLQPAVSICNLGLVEAQKLLPLGSALIEPVPTNRSLYTFIVTKTSSTTLIGAVTKERVSTMTRDFLELMKLRAAHADSAVNQVHSIDKRVQEGVVGLYAAFIQPIERSLPPTTKLIVIPQRDFSALPFHALRKSSSGAGSPYVCERYSVTYLPAAIGLTVCQTAGARSRAQDDSGPSANDIVALGCPGETTWDVEYELRDIRAFYKDTRLYFNQQATIATLQKEKGIVLHLAAEFRHNDRAPWNAHLLLSDGKAVNTTRRVPWGELCTLRPFTTVILSDLGREIATIEPAQPLLFLMNGSASVVLGAFPPSRKAKKVFGEQFYTALLAGQTGQMAYRRAQLEMLKNPDFASPYLWGSFFLWGL